MFWAGVFFIVFFFFFFFFFFCHTPLFEYNHILLFAFHKIKCRNIQTDVAMAKAMCKIKMTLI